MIYAALMSMSLTLDQASYALRRALDTVGLADSMRVTLEKQIEFEFLYEVYGEAVEQEEVLELIVG